MMLAEKSQKLPLGYESEIFKIGEFGSATDQERSLSGLRRRLKRGLVMMSGIGLGFWRGSWRDSGREPPGKRTSLQALSQQLLLR
jgi:hypothetical protein